MIACESCNATGRDVNDLSCEKCGGTGMSPSINVDLNGSVSHLRRSLSVITKELKRREAAITGRP